MPGASKKACTARSQLCLLPSILPCGEPPPTPCLHCRVGFVSVECGSTLLLRMSRGVAGVGQAECCLLASGHSLVACRCGWMLCARENPHSCSRRVSVHRQHLAGPVSGLPPLPCVQVLPGLYALCLPSSHRRFLYAVRAGGMGRGMDSWPWL